MHPKYINIIIATSNLIGIIPIVKSDNDIERILILSVMCISFFTHISDRTHGLPGFILGKYSTDLLTMDRIITCISVLYFLFEYNLTLRILPHIIIGFTALFLSETMFNFKYSFAVSHSIWHFCAFLGVDALRNT